MPQSAVHPLEKVTHEVGQPAMTRESWSHESLSHAHLAKGRIQGSLPVSDSVLLASLTSASGGRREVDWCGCEWAGVEGGYLPNSTMILAKAKHATPTSTTGSRREPSEAKHLPITSGRA